MTQAERIINALRASRTGLTYGEMQDLHISTSPHRRLSPDERPERFLRKGERIVRKTGRDGLVRVAVVKG